MSHVQDVLVPYARRALPEWLCDWRVTPARAAVLDELRRYRGDPGLDERAALAILMAWMDDDVKAAPLKTAQGYVWAEGYADGSLRGHVYDEVPRVLDRWRADGIRCYIYSSGSVPAQRDWFGHSNHGDLTGLLSGYFDLTSAGSKVEPASYRCVTKAIAVPPEATLFVSDVAVELDAASHAGWWTIGVRRPGDPRGLVVSGYPTVSSLDAFRVTSARSAPSPSQTGRA